MCRDGVGGTSEAGSDIYGHVGLTLGFASRVDPGSVTYWLPT